MTDGPDEAVVRAALSFVDEMLAQTQIADFAEADHWIVELRDPQTGAVTRAGVWAADEQQEAVRWAIEQEQKLNAGIGEDETPYACVALPVHKWMS